MSKKEFLENLFHALNSGMSKEEIYSHIQYYDEYIENEKTNGLTEEEVISRLGNPRLIAKTILDSSGSKTYAQQDYTSYEEQEQPKEKESILKKIKRALIIILVCIILFFFLRAGFILFWKFGLPIIIVILLIRLVNKMLK